MYRFLSIQFKVFLTLISISIKALELGCLYSSLLGGFGMVGDKRNNVEPTKKEDVNWKKSRDENEETEDRGQRRGMG